jgi:phytanoyl-CoA hydroxylase
VSVVAGTEAAEAISMGDYDEDYYLEQYPDVAEGVAKGEWLSGYSHFAEIGRSRGRLGLPVIDETWYLRAYPLAANEIALGKAANCVEHYLKYGRYRGYVSERTARRPPNAANFRSRFGGLWTDQGNALDIVAGRLELGRISESEAELLTKWIQDGFVILEGAIEEDILDRALADLDKAYEGLLPGQKFAVHGVGQQIDWVPEARTNPTKALDIHWFSSAIRDLIFAPKVLSFMHLVFERRAMASQTLGFLRGSAQDAHQDSAYVNYTLPMQFVASWIALEDVTPGAGELFYYVASHRLREFLYGRNEFKGAEEARRLGFPGDIEGQIKAHVQRIPKLAESLNLKQGALIAKRGDVLFWNADLAHGGSRISSNYTRKSVVTHYCPAEVMPTYVDYRPKVVIKPHNGQTYYTSSHYGDIESV